MTAKFSPKRYADLLADTLPQIIESEAEYERLLAVVEPMMSREASLSPEEAKLFDLLVKLIQDYEDAHYPIEPAPPHQVLQHLLEARGLQQEVLTPLFGSRARAAEVLNGVRAISKTQAQKLADFFHVSPELFV
ncbi:MAG: transcriptional regulator [Acidobacteria bacterium]|nr:transcriptional regulator [Acidobacteriota bacterium]MBI3427688.1 transcriptional regulator [Acidobacteriota bacterium]